MVRDACAQHDKIPMIASHPKSNSINTGDVKTEENSLNATDAARLLGALPGTASLLAGLRNVSTDGPLLRPASDDARLMGIPTMLAQENPSYGTPESPVYAVSGAAYTNTTSPFRYDNGAGFPNIGDTAVGDTPAALGVDNNRRSDLGGDLGDESVRAEASALLRDIESLDSDAREKLSFAKPALEAAIKSGKPPGVGLGAIRELILSAQLAAKEGRAETAAEKKERLWTAAKLAEEEAQKASHKLDKYKTEGELNAEKDAERKYKEALDELERLKASGASEADIEAAERHVIATQKVLSTARETSIQGVIDNPETKPEIRREAEQAKKTNSDTQQQWKQATEAFEEASKNLQVERQREEAVKLEVARAEEKLKKSEAALAEKQQKSAQVNQEFDNLLAALEGGEPATPATTQGAAANVKLAHAQADTVGAAPHFKNTTTSAGVGPRQG